MSANTKCPHDQEYCVQMHIAERAGNASGACPISHFMCERFHTAIQGVFRGHRCPYDGRYCVEFANVQNRAVIDFECPNPLKDCARRVQKAR